MQITQFFLYLAVMAGVTYLIRAVPLALCRGEIKNRFLKSFLAYVPYAVLGAMTFPEIIYSTGNIVSGIAGMLVALVLAFFERGLLTVALGACLVSFVTGLL